MAVTIVGYGSDKDKWNGFSEIQVCAHVPGHDSSMEESSSTPTSERLSPGFEGIVRELPFPEGQRGFNVVNMYVTNRGCTVLFHSCAFESGRWKHRLKLKCHS